MRRRNFVHCMAVLLAAPFLLLGSASSAHAFCVEKAFIFTVYCGGQGHDTINDHALGFLSPGILGHIKNKNTDQDGLFTEGRPELHFTNCLFTKSTDYIRSQYDQVLDAIQSDSPFSGPKDSYTAAMRWGQLLHPVQDFYSHSPWVDRTPVGLGFGTTYQRRLLDSGLSNWRRLGPFERLFPNDPVHGDIVTIQGQSARTIELPRDSSGNPTSAVPIVGGLQPLRGLVTANSSPFTNGLGQCPPAGISVTENGTDVTCKDIESVCIRHGGSECSDVNGTNSRPIYDNCLNHDNDSRENWRVAFNSAVDQTKHEWCRLLHLTRDRKSYNAASFLMALWVDRDYRPVLTPHIAGTPCAPERKSGRDLRLTIEVKALRDNPTRPTQTLSFVAYTGDFRESVRKLIRPEDPTWASLDICINRDDTLLTTLWGWSDSGLYNDYFDPHDSVLAGITTGFSGASLLGAERERSTRDLQLRVKLSPDPSPDCRS